jgi:cytoskeletal protein CcmA (bactofilin family)
MAVENTPARIGKSVLIRGEVKGSEDLFVDGRVEGTISLSESRLTIGPNAVLAADLTARDVLILGQVQGNVVRALRLAIEDNAVFRGKVDLTQGPAKAADPAATTQAEG